MLEGIFYDNKNEDKFLRKRSQTTIQEYLKSASHDVYISGITNNGVMSIFTNNYDLLKDCVNRGIKIHILFYVADEEINFNWYLKMLYGFDNSENIVENNIKNDKEIYKTLIGYIKTQRGFKLLNDNHLCIFRPD